MADMISMDIDWSEVERLAKRFEGADDLVFDEMETAMLESLRLFQDAVVGESPWNTGALSQSIGSDVYGDPPDFYGEVTAGVLYAAPVEYGRRPGKPPPLTPILYWVVRKGLASGDEAVHVANAIRFAIAKRGTYADQAKRGARMFEKGFDLAAGPVADVWDGMAERLVERLAR